MVLKIATDCSGMEAPIQAIRNMLGDNYKHVFSCDINEHARATIRANFPHGTMYEDITKRDNTKIPQVDLYIAGFPCQPFSTAGLGQGFGDEKGRGEIFFNCLDFLKKNRPKVFVLENVSGLAKKNNKEYLDAIMKSLKKLGDYNVNWKLLDTKEQGLPHSRRRWYCVGIRQDVDNGTFEFPEKIKCAGKIDALLEKRNPKLAREGLPPKSIKKIRGKKVRRSSTARINVIAAIRKIRSKGQDAHRTTYLVDCDSSPYRSVHVKGVCPCITVSRAGGHWVTSRGRRTTKTEMMRLQGMNPTKFKLAVSEIQLGRQLGNTMSVNVLERLFVRLLPAAKLVRRNEVEDRWENGKAFRELVNTVGKSFSKKTIVEAPRRGRECSPSPSRVGKRRGASTTPERPTKRRAVASPKSSRK